MTLQGFSTLSTDGLDGSSGGALLTSFTKECSPSPWWNDADDYVSETSGFFVRWQHERGGLHLKQNMFLQADATGVSEPDLHAMELRWLCNEILAALPDRGLEEILESLARAYEFYSLPTPPPAARPQEPRRLLKVKVGSRVSRPVFTLPEE